MARLVLVAGAQVEQDDVTGRGPADELGATDRLELVGGAEVGPNDLLDLGQAIVGHATERGQQLEHVITDEAVKDSGALTSSVDQACSSEGLEMGRGQCDAHVGLGRQCLDAVLALGKQVEELDPPGTGEGLADPGELLVERGLRGARRCHSSIPTMFGIR